MIKTILLLPDGTELSSGTGTENAIQSVSLTQCVNDGEELSLGSVCSNMIELTAISPNGGLSIGEGDEFTVFQEDGDGRHQIGIFIAEKPKRASANTFKVTAYDRVCLLDKDLTQWLNGLEEWPYSLYQLSEMVCEQCGVTFASTSFPNAGHSIYQFTATNVTGRQLLHWVGELAGRFCRATPEGTVKFAWYCQLTTPQIGAGTEYDTDVVYDTDGNLTITGDISLNTTADGDVKIGYDSMTLSYDSEGNVLLDIPQRVTIQHYFQGGLSYEDYQVAAIEKVQIKNSQEDVGTVYPPDISGSVNTYIISGNPMTAAARAADLTDMAQKLYTQLSAVSYTPCTVSIPAGFLFSAGDILTVTDKNGTVLTVYAMTVKQAGQRQTIGCTGNARRDSTTAVNKSGYKSLAGKVLNLTTTVDGLKVENQDTSGKIASVQLDVDGLDARVGLNEMNISQLKMDADSITAEVSRQNESLDSFSQELTRIEQKADSVKISVESITENGTSKVTTSTGYTFGEDGLRIKKTGQEMENLLDETGMTVSRGETVMLKADKDGVTATDVTVRNFLIVGEHARFEDYSGSRTACFWI